MPKVNLKKVQIREKMLKKRLSLTPEEMDVKSAIISSKVSWLNLFKEAGNVLIYLPINNEVETKFMISLLNDGKKKLLLPVYDKKQWLVSAYFPDDRLTEGPYKIPQPARIRKVSPYEVDLAILPALAFGKNGVRVGYGKGVYDALLKDSKCIKVGICYDFQIADHIKADKHDILVDYVVTEERIYKVDS